MYFCNCLNVRVRIKETEAPTTVEEYLKRGNNSTEQVQTLQACINEKILPADFSSFLIGSSISGVESQYSSFVCKEEKPKSGWYEYECKNCNTFCCIYCKSLNQYFLNANALINEQEANILKETHKDLYEYSDIFQVIIDPTILSSNKHVEERRKKQLSLEECATAAASVAKISWEQHPELVQVQLAMQEKLTNLKSKMQQRILEFEQKERREFETVFLKAHKEKRVIFYRMKQILDANTSLSKATAQPSSSITTSAPSHPQQILATEKPVKETPSILKTITEESKSIVPTQSNKPLKPLSKSTSATALVTEQQETAKVEQITENSLHSVILLSQKHNRSRRPSIVSTSSTASNRNVDRILSSTYKESALFSLEDDDRQSQVSDEEEDDSLDMEDINEDVINDQDGYNSDSYNTSQESSKNVTTQNSVIIAPPSRKQSQTDTTIAHSMPVAIPPKMLVPKTFGVQQSQKRDSNTQQNAVLKARQKQRIPYEQEDEDDSGEQGTDELHYRSNSRYIFDREQFSYIGSYMKLREMQARTQNTKEREEEEDDFNL